MKRTPTANRGFSLLEILIAVGLGGFFLLGATFFLTGLSQAWINKSNERSFSDHAEGIGIFLNQALARSEAIDDQQTLPVEWRDPPGWGEFEEPLLAFQLREAPPILTVGEENFPGVVCYLWFDRNDGLYLLWHSRLHEVEEVEDVYHIQLSPYAEKMEYAYYEFEDDEWDFTEEPEPGEDPDLFLLPHFLRFTFADPDTGETFVAPVYVPQQAITAPTF